MCFRPIGWLEAKMDAGLYVWENYDSHYASRPNFKWDMDVHYLGRKITAGVNLGYHSGIKWMVATVMPEAMFSYVQTPSAFTLGLEAEWRINDHWGVFAEGRNLTGSAVYEWLHYYSDSPEGLLGVKFSF